MLRFSQKNLPVDLTDDSDVLSRKKGHVKKRVNVLLLAILIGGIGSSSAFAEFRSSKDMQKECRVALDFYRARLR